MKIIRKLFNRQIYIEGLLQTKWIALILFLTGVLAMKPFSLSSSTNELLHLFCFICPLIMALLLFGFLNKRAGSDFYYGLSQERITIYGSYCLVILTWIGLSLLLLFGLSYLSGGSAINQYVKQTDAFEPCPFGRFEFHGILFLYYVSVGILTLGATVLAMSLTGNVITNIMTVLAILLIPRLLFDNYINGFYDLCPYLSKSDFIGRLTDSSYNVVYELIDVDTYLNYAWWKEYEYAGIAIVYSSILGVAYMILGGICFCRRKSELAGKASVNRFFQVMLRMVITLAIGIIPVMNMVKYFVGQRDGMVLFECVLWYVFIALLWLLIEFLTTKSAEKVIKSLLQLPILAAFNVVIIVVLVGTITCVAENIPEKEEVTSVEILIDEEEEFSYFVCSENGVSNYMVDILDDAGCLQLTSDAAKELLLTELAEDIELCHTNYEEYEEDTYLDFNWPIRFWQGEKCISRIVSLDEKMSDLVWEAIRENADHTYDYTFPMCSPEELQIIDETEVVSFDCDEIGQWMRAKEYFKIYALLYEEWKAFNPPLSYFLENAPLEGSIGSLRVIMEKYNYCVPISMDTPKSMVLVANYINEHESSFNFDWFVQDIKDGKTFGPLYVRLFEKGTDTVIEQTFEAYSGPARAGLELTKKDLEKWQVLFNSHDKDEVVKAGETMLYVAYYDSFSERQWFNLTDEETKLVKELMEVE